MMGSLVRNFYSHGLCLYVLSLLPAPNCVPIITNQSSSSTTIIIITVTIIIISGGALHILFYTYKSREIVTTTDYIDTHVCVWAWA